MNFGMDYQAGGGGGGMMGGEGSYGGGGGSYGGGASVASPPPSRQGRKSYDQQSLTPVTINMVLKSKPSSSSEGTGTLDLPDGRDLYQVKIVGAIRAYDEQSTNVTFSIEDGTGLISVKQWLDDNDCAAVHEMRSACLVDHIYVKVIGQVKDYDGSKSIVAHAVRRLTSANEFTYHMLEVVYSGERFKRRDTIVAQPSMMQSGVGVGFGAPLAGAPIANVGGGHDGSVLQAVLQFYKTDGEASEVGAPAHMCVEKLTRNGAFTEQEVRQAIHQMSSDGNLYSTINEDCFKLVEA